MIIPEQYLTDEDKLERLRAKENEAVALAGRSWHARDTNTVRAIQLHADGFLTPPIRIRDSAGLTGNCFIGQAVKVNLQTH